MCGRMAACLVSSSVARVTALTADMQHNYIIRTLRTVGNGVRGLGWDLRGANWVTKPSSQFVLHKLRKPIVRQVLELVAGARYVPNRQLLSIPFPSDLI